MVIQATWRRTRLSGRAVRPDDTIPTGLLETSAHVAERSWPKRMLVILAVVVVFMAATARLFVWPARGVPAHADAIVLFNGHGNRLDGALGLAYAHVAPNLVISRGTPTATNSCSPPIDGVTVTCFSPNPGTTQGEAEFVGRLATERNWHSLILVTTRAQDTRARVRMRRCFPGHVDVATVHLRTREWPRTVAYEWAAMAKAFVVQRHC
jgi:hypothetical protein